MLRRFVGSCAVLGTSLGLGCAPRISKPQEPALKPEARGRSAILYRDDSELVAGNATAAMPPAEGYVPFQPGESPGSLRALFQGRNTIFLRATRSGHCVARSFDEIGPTYATYHEDEAVYDACRVREFYTLKFSHGPWGEATIDQNEAREPRILGGCDRGIGLGIALCGEPVFHVIEADQEHVKVIEARGHLGKDKRASAYDGRAAVDWYFDRAACEAARSAATDGPRQPCGG